MRYLTALCTSASACPVLLALFGGCSTNRGDEPVTSVAQRVEAGEFALLNEIKFNPPTQAEDGYEYVELVGTPNATLEDHYVVAVGNNGLVTYIVDLGTACNGSCSFDSGGLLFIGNTTNYPSGLENSVTGTAIDNGEVLNGDERGGAASFLLAKITGTAPAVGEPWTTTSGTTVVDAYAINDGSINGAVVVGNVVDTTDADAAVRRTGNTTPNLLDAWFSGELDGDAETTTFDSGETLTPGAANSVEESGAGGAGGAAGAPAVTGGALPTGGAPPAAGAGGAAGTSAATGGAPPAAGSAAIEAGAGGAAGAPQDNGGASPTAGAAPEAGSAGVGDVGGAPSAGGGGEHATAGASAVAGAGAAGSPEQQETGGRSSTGGVTSTGGRFATGGRNPFLSGGTTSSAGGRVGTGGRSGGSTNTGGRTGTTSSGGTMSGVGGYAYATGGFGDDDDDDDSGCGCRVAGREHGSSSGLVALMAAALLAVRRRRSR